MHTYASLNRPKTVEPRRPLLYAAASSIDRPLNPAHPNPPHSTTHTHSQPMSGSPLLQSAELLRLGASAAKELAFDALRGKQVAIYFSGAHICFTYQVGIEIESNQIVRVPSKQRSPLDAHDVNPNPNRPPSVPPCTQRRGARPAAPSRPSSLPSTGRPRRRASRWCGAPPTTTRRSSMTTPKRWGPGWRCPSRTRRSGRS